MWAMRSPRLLPRATYAVLVGFVFPAAMSLEGSILIDLGRVYLVKVFGCGGESLGLQLEKDFVMVAGEAMSFAEAERPILFTTAL